MDDPEGKEMLSPHGSLLKHLIKKRKPTTKKKQKQNYVIGCPQKWIWEELISEWG